MFEALTDLCRLARAEFGQDATLHVSGKTMAERKRRGICGFSFDCPTMTARRGIDSGLSPMNTSGKATPSARGGLSLTRISRPHDERDAIRLLQLFAFAQAILKLDLPDCDRETVLRSVVSRIYFAAFGHLSRHATERLGFHAGQDAEDHGRLRRHLRNHSIRRLPSASTSCESGETSAITVTSSLRTSRNSPGRPRRR